METLFEESRKEKEESMRDVVADGGGSQGHSRRNRSAGASQMAHDTTATCRTRQFSQIGARGRVSQPQSTVTTDQPNPPIRPPTPFQGDYMIGGNRPGWLGLRRVSSPTSAASAVLAGSMSPFSPIPLASSHSKNSPLGPPAIIGLQGGPHSFRRPPTTQSMSQVGRSPTHSNSASSPQSNTDSQASAVGPRPSGTVSSALALSSTSLQSPHQPSLSLVSDGFPLKGTPNRLDNRCNSATPARRGQSQGSEGHASPPQLLYRSWSVRPSELNVRPAGTNNPYAASFGAIITHSLRSPAPPAPPLLPGGGATAAGPRNLPDPSGAANVISQEGRISARELVGRRQQWLPEQRGQQRPRELGGRQLESNNSFALPSLHLGLVGQTNDGITSVQIDPVKAKLKARDGLGRVQLELARQGRERTGREDTGGEPWTGLRSLRSDRKKAQRELEGTIDGARKTSPLVIERGQHYDVVSKEHIPYQIIENLGHGRHGRVDRVKDAVSGRIFAQKVTKNTRAATIEEAKKGYLNEVEIVRKLADNPHIIKLFASYVFKRELGLILEPVADGGDLASFLQDLRDSQRPPTERETGIIWRAFPCLASGLAFIHDRHVRHKDIKPSNILIHKGSVIFTDFGISFDSSTSSGSTTGSGAPHALSRKYSAPEVVNWGRRNSSSDIFSLGCVYVELLAVLSPESTVPGALGRNYYENLNPVTDECVTNRDSGHRAFRHIGICVRMMIELHKDVRFTARQLAFTLLQPGFTTYYRFPCCQDCIQALPQLGEGYHADYTREEEFCFLYDTKPFQSAILQLGHSNFWIANATAFENFSSSHKIIELTLIKKFKFSSIIHGIESNYTLRSLINLLDIYEGLGLELKARFVRNQIYLLCPRIGVAPDEKAFFFNLRRKRSTYLKINPHLPFGASGQWTLTELSANEIINFLLQGNSSSEESGR